MPIAVAASRANMAVSKAARPVTLTFDLESGVRVTCDVGYFCAPILVFLRLSVLDLRTMYATDRRQTDRQM